MYKENFAKFLVIFVQRYFYPCKNRIGTKKKKQNKTKQKQTKQNKQTNKIQNKNKNTFMAISQKGNF